jgi:hypothetical protein
MMHTISFKRYSIKQHQATGNLGPVFCPLFFFLSKTQKLLQNVAKIKYLGMTVTNNNTYI